MSFMEALDNELSVTTTLNGGKTYSTTGDACLDLFAIAGGMRYKRAGEQIAMFDRAYIENPELAMKLLFYIRDIRGGLGERELFRTLICHVAETWPESAKKNVALVAEYGRFDDLMCMMGTACEHEVIEFIRSQLDADLAALERRMAGDNNAHISLLAKWLPSINTSSNRTRSQAKVLAQALELSEGEYRKTLSKLRARIGLTERLLTAGKMDKINYEAVPAKAMLKYREVFISKDRNRFEGYLDQVNCGGKKIHADPLFPYEVIRPMFNGYQSVKHAKGNEVLEALWSKRTDDVAGENAICVVDTSGSMYWGREGNPLPALIAQSLGLLYAERCKGLFHNTFITFESEPHLMKVVGNTLEDKLCYMQAAPWGGSTNLMKVFEVILNAAIKVHAGQEEMPSTIYIISDMEFDIAMRGADETVYEAARELFELNGYEMPAVVFHNVNSWQQQAPVRAKTRGTALVSGAGTSSFKAKFDGNITPLDHMLRVLNGERYAAVHA